ncbi:MAG: glycosyltransferase family 2 protein [Bacteroidota bacterium]
MKTLNSKQHSDLAIVIPAYKGKYFQETLYSLSRQTCKQFTVYVGDDFSPDNLRAICDQFKNEFRIVFYRFQENYGRQSLAKHWTRCVKLSNEPWIWLFSDDDIADPICVEEFYKTLKVSNGDVNVYRFNNRIINGNDEIIHDGNSIPQIESAIDYAIARMNSSRKSFVTDHIFSREAFNKNGGFIEFPTGFASDDASWIAMSHGKEIYTLSGGVVSWRLSSDNISGVENKYGKEKLEAMIKYIAWSKQYFSEIDKVPAAKYQQLMQSSKMWLTKNILHLRYYISSGELVKISGELSVIWQEKYYISIARLIIIKFIVCILNISQFNKNKMVLSLQ